MFVQLLVILVLLIPILAIVLDSRVGHALAARLEGKQLSVGDEVPGDRLKFLEGEIERLGQEVERLGEESDFLHNLLAERPKPRALTEGDLHEGELHERDPSEVDTVGGDGSERG